MTIEYSTHKIAQNGSLNLRKKWLKGQLGIESEKESVLEIKIKDLDAVVLLKFDPLAPIPELIKKLGTGELTISSNTQEVTAPGTPTSTPEQGAVPAVIVSN